MDTITWNTFDSALASANNDLLLLGDFNVAPLMPRVPPTPPTSHPNSPEDRNQLVSISTTFFAAAQLDVLPPDLILLSVDHVFFNVHSHKLLSATTNGFNGLLPHMSTERRETDPILQVSEKANIINLILHAIYGLVCTHYAPDLEQLSEAIHTFPKYGLSVPSLVTVGSPLFEPLVAAAANGRALDVYVLAASTGLHDLAVRSSAHLLSLSLASLSDSQAEAMGALYLKKLFFLHLGRADALKRLLLVPPSDHLRTATCGHAERAQLSRAWALAAAYLAWEGRPDVLPGTIEAAVKPLGEGLTCDRCRAALQERLHTLISQWALVKSTI